MVRPFAFCGLIYRKAPVCVSRYGCTGREPPMAATTKSALLEISQKEFAKLSKLVDAVDVNMAMKKGDEDTSI